MRHARAMHDRATHFGGAGFTLLEVLIALVVLSIGILGAAALQGVGLRGSHSAYLTSQAGLLGYDMADRIRANPGRLQYVDFASTCPNPITATELTDRDLAEWSCALENLLPGGAGTIAADVVPNPDFEDITRYTIVVEWSDLLVADEGDPWTFTLQIDL